MSILKNSELIEDDVYNCLIGNNINVERKDVLVSIQEKKDNKLCCTASIFKDDELIDSFTLVVGSNNLVSDFKKSKIFDISEYKHTLSIPHKNKSANQVDEDYASHNETILYMIEQKFDKQDIINAIKDFEVFANDNNISNIPTFEY